MAIYKCKMCGGDLNIEADINVIECEYCGTTQTVPTADNEKKVNLFNRANRLRLNSEFDKAAGIYESIIAEFPEEAEAYWGLCLCNYGIEYVDDPATAKKVPTCHRASFEKLANDENFNMAMEYADVVAQKVYRDEAREIDRIMDNILSISKNEKPYDVFICYKETDEKGERTIDSVLAQDVYDALTAKGMKVFFARITLEDKLGQMYEPYIFAALNSAKVMLSIGTKYEYFQAVWVKNEWSRFLKLMAKDKSKVLVPCYKDMDAYDLPDEFKALQAQDMGKIGFMQDLTRGIEKIVGVNTAPVTENSSNSDAKALTTRGYIYLEDRDFQQAETYFDRALDMNPMDSKAYVGKTLCTIQLTSLSELDNLVVDLSSFKDFERALRFAEGDFKKQLNDLKEKNEIKTEALKLVVGLKKIERKKAVLEETQKINDIIGAVKEALATGSPDALREPLMRYEAALKEGIKSKIFSEEGLKTYKKFLNILICLNGTDEYLSSDEMLKDNLISEIFSDTKDLETWMIYLLNINVIDTFNKNGKKYYGSKEAEEKRRTKRQSKEFLANLHEISAAREKISKIHNRYLAAGANHIVGLKADGTVEALGSNFNGQCDVGDWTDIVAVAAGSEHTVGLKKDGTVVATKYYGKYYNGQCDVSSWKDIVAIAAGSLRTFGLKSDGTIVTTGNNKDFQFANIDAFDGLTNLTSICSGYYKICALKNDGTVVDSSRNYFDWDHIVEYAEGDVHSLGLRDDGTIVCQGDAERSKFATDVEDWEDIIAISCGRCHTVALNKNGKVESCGDNTYGQCNVDNWTKVVAISAGDKFTVGLTKKGKILATGKIGTISAESLTQLDKIRLFNNAFDIENERKLIEEEKQKEMFEKEQIRIKNEQIRIEKEKETLNNKRIEEEKLNRRKQGLCQHCGGTFKGLFTKKCVKCGKEKDYGVTFF